MRALVYTGPEALELRDAPDPAPVPGEVALTVEAVGICGSDMHAFLGHDERRPAPLILGHEAAGRLADGSRVVVNPLVTCGVCEDCRAGRDNICASRQIISMPPREGAFAERLAMPPGNLIAIPEHVSSEMAALTEPLACGWHAVSLAERRGHKPLAEAVCLAQGGGAIGLGAALALRARGAREVWLAEPSAARRAMAEKAGDFRVFDPAASDGPGADAADIVIDGVGFASTRAAASRAVRRGGVIVHIGLGSAEGGLDIRRATLQEVTFVGAYTYTKRDFAETAQAIFDGRLGALDWPEIRPLSDGPAAFAALRAGTVAAPKIILRP
jgi:threonine dehydrogenase-like Zn-dependent dehydrogenase